MLRRAAASLTSLARRRAPAARPAVPRGVRAVPLRAMSSPAGGEGAGGDREGRRKVFWTGTLLSAMASGGLFYVFLSTFDDSVAVLGASAAEEKALGEQLGFDLELVMLGLQTVEWIASHRNVDDIEEVAAKVARIISDRYSTAFVAQLQLALRLRASREEGAREDADAALEEARSLAEEFGAHQGRLAYLLPTDEEWNEPGRASWNLRRASEAAPVWVLRAHVPPSPAASSPADGPFGRTEACTLVREEDGTLTLFNPVPLGADALAAVRALGTVARVVAQRRSEPFLRGVAADFPDAAVFALRVGDAGETMVGQIDRDAALELRPRAAEDLAAALGGGYEHLPVRGGDFAEVAFLHGASRTLVVAEACAVAEPGLPGASGRLRMFASGGLAFRNRGVFVPNQYVSMVTDRAALAESAAALVASRPARLVTATGAVVEGCATELERAFAFSASLGAVGQWYYAMRYRRRVGM